MQARQLAIFQGQESDLSAFLQLIPSHVQAIWLGNLPHFPLPNILRTVPFSQAKNLLGQEFPLIIYQAKQGINLEALAICAGTLTQGGLLLILSDNWQHMQVIEDQDSLRWSGENQAIITPHFYAHFQQLVYQFDFALLHHLPKIAFESTFSKNKLPLIPTVEQQHILQQLQHSQADILILTAKRGRGKSTLLGLLAQQFIQQNQPFLLTAPNKSAVQILQNMAGQELPFTAPDLLAQQLQQNGEIFSQWILLVDEAAMLPLALLHQFSQHFKQVIFSTTVQSYEGTGRGFMLKFATHLPRSVEHFQLHQPLRWKENDPLEQFVDQLLFLHQENTALAFYPTKVRYTIYSQTKLLTQNKLFDFYQLLSLAHYRTSPVDLRRLFDAPKQHFYLAENENHLLGGLWLIDEGNIQDAELIVAIQRGQRRPKGNLVAQSLCFHAHSTDACRLRSRRISRIAVQPHWQRQQIGSQLIEQAAQQAKQDHIDFLSVSFGYTAELFHFWQKCGFVLLNLGENKETSSGCYTVMMGKGISTQGQHFIEQIQQQFLRDLPLLIHPLLAEIQSTLPFAVKTVDWQLSALDKLILQNFANYHRTLYASTPAIRRLENYFPSKEKTIFIPNQNLSYSENMKKIRGKVRTLLQKLNNI